MCNFWTFEKWFFAFYEPHISSQIEIGKLPFETQTWNHWKMCTLYNLTLPPTAAAAATPLMLLLASTSLHTFWRLKCSSKVACKHYWRFNDRPLYSCWCQNFHCLPEIERLWLLQFNLLSPLRPVWRPNCAANMRRGTEARSKNERKKRKEKKK